MSKTITVFDWPGGGTWGLHQLVFAHYIEELSGLSISELSDVNYGRSVGSVGATSSLIPHPNDPSKPKFKMSEIIKTFYGVANDIFGNGLIRDHQSRAVQHDLRNLTGRRIFKDNSGNMHLDHSKLSEALSECYGDTKLNQLLKSTFILSQHFETSTTVSHSHIDQKLFDAKRWSIIQNLGGEDRVVDAVMSSTAAPTVFNAYSYDSGKNSYIDGAANYGPSDILLNLQNMHDGPVKFKVVTLGTGDLTNNVRDARQYADFGWLRMGQGHNNAISNEMVVRDYDRMNVFFDDIEHFTLDTNVSELELDNKKYEYTPFNGRIEDLDFIIDTAVASAKRQTENMKLLIEGICEDRIRNTMPSIASTRVTEAFYKALRKKLPRLTPLNAIPFEDAIIRSANTDINQHNTFSEDGIKKLVKGEAQSLQNTTKIPQSNVMKLASQIPFVGRMIKPSPSPA